MKKSHTACQPVRQTPEYTAFDEHRSALDGQPQQWQSVHFNTRQSGKIHSLFTACMAFGAAVFVSLMAAAAVVSHDMPLMLGGF